LFAHSQSFNVNKQQTDEATNWFTNDRTIVTTCHVTNIAANHYAINTTVYATIIASIKPTHDISKQYSYQATGD
jgi:hypothetical protein